MAVIKSPFSAACWPDSAEDLSVAAGAGKQTCWAQVRLKGGMGWQRPGRKEARRMKQQARVCLEGEGQGATEWEMRQRITGPENLHLHCLL